MAKELCWGLIFVSDGARVVSGIMRYTWRVGDCGWRRAFHV